MARNTGKVRRSVRNRPSTCMFRSKRASTLKNGALCMVLYSPRTLHRGRTMRSAGRPRFGDAEGLCRRPCSLSSSRCLSEPNMNERKTGRKSVLHAKQIETTGVPGVVLSVQRTIHIYIFFLIHSTWNFCTRPGLSSRKHVIQYN